MINLAKEKADTANIENVSFAQDDIFDGGYERESFDAILAFNMMHTVPKPQEVMKRIHELLKQ